MIIQCLNEDGPAVRAIHNSGVVVRGKHDDTLHYCLPCYEEWINRYGSTRPNIYVNKITIKENK